MKTINTIAGNVYCVTSKNGGILTDATGTLNETVEAGKQLHVTAPSDRLLIDDDEAIMRPANFKNARLALRMLEAGSNGLNLGKYAACTTVAEMKAVDSRYGFDLTADKGWVYPLPRLINGYGMLCRLFNNVSEAIRYIRLNAPVCTSLDSAFAHQLHLESFSGYVPKVEVGSYAFFTDYLNKLKSVNATFPSLFSAGGMFGKCILNKASVLRVAASVPKWTSGTHNITFGIHVDHKYDPEVNAALKKLDSRYEPLNLPIDETTGDYVEITENKGWNLTVQWNGTATENAYPQPMAAYSRRALSSPVYAKVNVIKLNDGSLRHVLDWGHYVTEWEVNGYQEFGSEEEAAEAFGLTPYESPEELLTEA